MFLNFDKIEKVGSNKFAIKVSEDSTFPDRKDISNEELCKMDELVRKLVGTLEKDIVTAAYEFIDGMTFIRLTIDTKINREIREFTDMLDNSMPEDLESNIKLNIRTKQSIIKELDKFDERLLVCHNLLVSWLCINTSELPESYWYDNGIPTTCDIEDLQYYIDEELLEDYTIVKGSE